MTTHHPDEHDHDEDESELDIFDQFELEPEEIRGAFDHDVHPDAADGEWLMSALDTLARVAITDRGIHPVAMASALGAYSAAFKGRVTAARNATGDDSPFASLEQEYDKQRYSALPYLQFMQAMEDADLGGPMGGIGVMTPDDLPEGARDELMRRVRAQFGKGGQEGMFQ